MSVSVFPLRLSDLPPQFENFCFTEFYIELLVFLYSTQEEKKKSALA